MIGRPWGQTLAGSVADDDTVDNQQTYQRMVDYYQRRAPTYDVVYGPSERQPDLARVAELLQSLVADRDVLELAAGTGYWTPTLAATAASVYATDANPAPLAIAAARDYPRGNVRFGYADAFDLGPVPGEFTACFAGFWWSHVLLADLDRFVRGVCARVRPGSVVAFLDNRFVPGSSHPISRTDPEGNTYQRRQVPDGPAYDVVKNFPTAARLLDVACRHSAEAEVAELHFFWLLTLRTGP